VGQLIEFPSGRIITGPPEPEVMQDPLFTLVARVASACFDALAATTPDAPDPRPPFQGPTA